MAREKPLISRYLWVSTPTTLVGQHAKLGGTRFGIALSPERNIAALAIDGLYRTDHHLVIEQGRTKAEHDPQKVVAAHVRRLEALHRAGIVECVILARNLLESCATWSWRRSPMILLPKRVWSTTQWPMGGHLVTGICQRSIMLDSGRYAMLDDGVGFSMVPWKSDRGSNSPQGGGLPWKVGRQRGLTM